MKPTPLLTIAVPTYNRAPSLRRSLTALICQIDGIPRGWERIELLVSDNCSTDDTPAVIASFTQTSPLKAARNAENLGMDGNFIALFQRASGRHFWIFSDDDLLVDNALKKILVLLEQESPDLVYLKARFLFGELDSFPTAALDFDFLDVSGDMFTLRSNSTLSFLSSVISHRERYLQMTAGGQPDRFRGSFLPHFEWVFTLLAQGERFFITSLAPVLARTGATGGYSLYQVFCDNLVAICRDRLKIVPRRCRLLEDAHLFIHLPGFVMRSRENSFGKFQFSPEDAARHIGDSFGRGLFFRLLMRPMIFGGDWLALLAFKCSRVYGLYWSATRRLLLLFDGNRPRTVVLRALAEPL